MCFSLSLGLRWIFVGLEVLWICIRFPLDARWISVVFLLDALVVFRCSLDYRRMGLLWGSCEMFYGCSLVSVWRGLLKVLWMLPWFALDFISMLIDAR